MKYHSIRTYSALCERYFASKAECRRGEELKLLQMAGEISGLEFQKKYTLSDKPKITISIDFAYAEAGKFVLEDTKGVLTRDFRTKMAWLKEKLGLEVRLTR
ncbi:hypothetical protein LCGC14_0628030 [marine sediment metagenome]|uniref:DUF1064 domain-containing protein n=1 Tax=marine sediment metagenome TaxID=412755 RepID=A0A0F9UBE9_9ZZZZ